MSTLLIVIEVILLVCFSALCSGLNVGLMSLGTGDLQRKAKLGNIQAQRVLPLRKNSNLSLASILLTNVAVISANTLVLHQLFAGWVAGILSTLLIVVFGEVLPQALFTKQPLAFTSRFASLLNIMITITYPLSKPLQLLLDQLFGPERLPLQSRHELGILIGEHLASNESELDDDEIEIMQGALQLSEKRVRDIMTPINTVYWLSPTDMIDGQKIDEIKDMGRSRMPVLDQHLTKCYGILLMKDLVDINFNGAPKRVQELPLYPAQILGSMTALDTLFRTFIASGTHLLPVERDDQIVGIVTIEDLIEEIVGHEIVDETDRQLSRS
jgi:metal transporter CNNM